jgi:DNA polymerase-3 subunit gamma/tau
MLSDKLRPRTLNDVIGQDSVVKILKEQLKNNKLSNVLFFIGNSGAGKTTLATIIATTLSCDNIKNVDGVPTPCGICSSCKDVIEERLQKNVSIYNGSDVTADAIRELEKNLQYATFDGKPKVIIINEAQLVKELKRLLEIIETTKEDVYFIFTSTDKSKFSNMSGKDNKSQETQALRSRGSYFNIKAFNTKDVSDYLFSLLESIDPDEKIPETFIEEGIQVIAENCHGNIRQALNDFSQCIDGEIYTEKEIRNLLGYEDEKEFSNILYGIALKKTDIFEKLKDVDVQSFFNYSWVILNSAGIKGITNEVYKEPWKEKTAKALLDTNNVFSLSSLYEKVYASCNGYFNEKIFYSHLIDYFSEKKSTSSTSDDNKIVKKVKKV